jgi:hypothetical protein
MTRIILPFAALLTSLIVISCDDENETKPIVQRSTAQFENSSLSLSEMSEVSRIVIAFSRNSTADGEIQIRVNSSNIEKFSVPTRPCRRNY